MSKKCSVDGKYNMCNIVDVEKNENSMYQFVKDFSRDMANTTLPVGGKIISTNSSNVGDIPDIAQVPSKRVNLSLNNISRKRPNCFIKEESSQLEKNVKKKTTKDENFTFLPVITTHKPPPKAQASTSRQKTETNSKPLANNKDDMKVDPFRNLTLITGNVEFVMKIHKFYGSLDLLYEVFGKILRTSPGKFLCEQIILLRNESGPVLQAVFYEIDRKMPAISVGADIRCVGKFKGASRFHLFKIKPLNVPPNEESLVRLQNLCNFTLNNMRDRVK